jgi:hypothetical protein
MPKFTDGMADAIYNSLAEGTPCLVGTVSPEGYPQISPKGSVMVHEGSKLAYWERSHRGARTNVESGSKVMVYYRNPERAADLPQGAVVRAYGTARVVAEGPERDAIMAKVVQKELDADPGRKGAAVIIDVERIENLRSENVGE